MVLSSIFFASAGRDALIADIAKTSIKELMEEEMLRQQSSVDIQTEEFDSTRGGYMKKNRKIRSKSSTRACDIRELDAAET
ncbi:hypothetical protein RHGRI_011638 [Rhododendron griersonianum]|uniref:Uncharacterized protein n=1 Tax=Rhododendron griersonianum TaxID=479676 RepID=A0AAV6KNN4_9ERIC|nr:hypothetical protein RHGRI_011638 [Rhododendron griersonianum]